MVDSEVAFEFVNGGISFFTDIQDVVVSIILHKNGPDSGVVTIAVLLLFKVPYDNADQLLFFDSLQFVGFCVALVEFLSSRGYSLF